MIVVDVETSGTNTHKHSIVAIGAVDFIHPHNQFYEECRIFDGAHVMKEALAVNGMSEEGIRDPLRQCDRDAVHHFISWASEIDDPLLGGHNPSFDRDFLRETAERYHIDWPFAFRTIDLHSICYAHLLRRGIKPPPTHPSKGDESLNLDAVSRYVGIPGEQRPHNALQGARQAAECLSRLIREKPLFEEFEALPIPWAA